MTVAEHFRAVLADLPRRGLTDDIVALEPRFAEASDPALQAEIAKLLGFYWLRRGDPDKATTWADRAQERLPHDADAAYNALYARFMQHRWDEVVDRARDALARHGDNFLLHGILAACLGALGRLPEARLAGTRCLAAKAAAATGTACDPTDIPVPPLDTSHPERNVVAFSLFGSAAKYTDGAILNARAAAFIYPGWTCRFYVDASVPETTIQALRQERAQIALVAGLPHRPYGTLWRFLVADDAAVDRYIVRDADSLLNVRERVAVDAWLTSGRHFHAMRDRFDHCDLVLAGLWGGVRGALPPMLPAIQAWFGRTRSVAGYTSDQDFLRESCWPTMRQSILIHDSQFAFGDSCDFPDVGRLPPGQWVGCDWNLTMARP